MQAKVVIVGTLNFSPDKVVSILPHLKALIDASRKEKGCLAYDAAVDIYEPGVIRISELWSDKECLEQHVGAPHVPVWHRALADIGAIRTQYVVCDVAGLQVV